MQQSRLSKCVSEMGSKLDIAESDKPLPTETVQTDSEEKTIRQKANCSAASTVVNNEVDAVVAAVDRVKQMPRQMYCELETIPEKSEDSDTLNGSNDVFIEDKEVEDVEGKENSRPDTVKDGSMIRTYSNSAVDDA